MEQQYIIRVTVEDPKGQRIFEMEASATENDLTTDRATPGIVTVVAALQRAVAKD
jgi:hypothetical protein